MSIVEVSNLSFSYNNSTNVINDVSFSIKEGSYTCIIGHNGSGKSTIAKLIAGLLEKKQGSIKVLGLEVTNDNIVEIRKKLGIVFQNPDNQFIGSTVRDDIAFGLENRRVPSKDMEQIICDSAKEIGISEILDKEPSALSGGQKQRVAIAGVIAMKPNIIIFDEATSMLDPKGKENIKSLIRKLHDDNQYTIISITHDIEEVLQSDDCIVLNKGTVFMHDVPSKVFENTKALRKIGLDVPFNIKIKEAFKEKGIHLNNDNLKGMAQYLWQLNSNH